MKPSTANEVDSVFVLFTAQSKNNIVTVLQRQAEQQLDVKEKKRISQFISRPAARTFNLIPSILLQCWEMSHKEVYRKPLSRMFTAAVISPTAVHLAILLMCNKMQQLAINLRLISIHYRARREATETLHATCCIIFHSCVMSWVTGGLHLKHWSNSCSESE